MSRWQKHLVARIVIISTLFLWGCFLSTPINITGTWTGSFTWTSGPATGITYPFSMELLHEGQTVTGTVTLPSHAALTFELPVVQGRARSINLDLIARGINTNVPTEPTVEFEIEGRFEQTSMSGEGTQTIDDATYDFEWEATLVTEPQPAGL